jgi:hypothetical protein
MSTHHAKPCEKGTVQAKNLRVSRERGICPDANVFKIDFRFR